MDPIPQGNKRMAVNAHQLDQHKEAQSIFYEIQARPYAVSEMVGKPANNCYFKGIELLQRLGVLGYAVRGRTGETFWDKALIPDEISSLYPKQHLVTHFFVEVEIDGVWWALDPTIDPALEKNGFQVGKWDESRTLCFPITKLYNHTEQIAYATQWNDPAYAQSYFADAGLFLKRLNGWLSTVRKG
jgi:hypothetical protein